MAHLLGPGADLLQAPLFLPGVLKNPEIHLLLGPETIVVADLGLERTKMPVLLLDRLDLPPVLLDTALCLDEPLVHAGKVFAETIVFRLKGLHRRDTTAEGLPLRDLPGKPGNCLFVPGKRGEPGIEARATFVVLPHLLARGAGLEAQAVACSLRLRHRGKLRLQGFVAPGDRGKGFEVGLQSPASCDLFLGLPALGTEPRDIGREHFSFPRKVQEAVAHNEQPIALPPGVIERRDGVLLYGAGTLCLLLRTGKVGAERRKAVAHGGGVELPEAPGELQRDPFPGIDDPLQVLHAVLPEVIDAEHLHEPIFPGPGPTLDQGEELLLPGIDGVSEVTRTHADDPLHLLPHLLDAACEELLVQVEVCLVEGRGGAALEPADDGVFVAAGHEVQADLADVLRARKGADDVVRIKPRPLEAVEGKEDGGDDAALAGPVVPDDPGDAVLEGDLLVAEPLEVAHGKFIQQHSLPPYAGR